MCSAIVQAAQLAGGDIQKGISAGVHVLNEKTAQLIEVGPASDDQRLFNIVLIQTEDMKYLQLYSKTPQLNPKVLHFSNPLAVNKLIGIYCYIIYSFLLLNHQIRPPHHFNKVYI